MFSKKVNILETFDSSCSIDLSPLHKLRMCTDDFSDAAIDMCERDAFTVAIEGNIGSGKTTFLQNISKWEPDIVEVHPEPVPLWKDLNGHNLLDLMYKDPRRWALSFQSYVQLTMLGIHVKEQSNPVKLMERSLYSARYCFVENLHKSNLLPSLDYTILDEWFGWLLKYQEFKVDLIVYIQTTPSVCHERINGRNRTEESGIPMSYLETLHQLHEDWLIRRIHGDLPAPVLVLDGDKDLSKQKETFIEHKEQILCGVTA